MEYTSYSQLRKDIDRLAEEKKYQELLAAVEAAIKTLPAEEYEQNYYDIVYARAYHYTNLQLYEECLAAIENDIADRGYTFPLDWKRFQPLQKLEGYPRLLAKNEALLKEAQEKSHFIYTVQLPEGYCPEKKYPVFFNLHGDGGSIKKTAPLWTPQVFLRKGFINVYLQCSYILFEDAYAWMKNVPQGRKEIRDCYELIAEQYSIDEERVLIGGFSGGAIMAIDATMANLIPSKGFICLCPVMKPEAFTAENVAAAVRRGVRGYLMEGESELPIAVEEEMLKAFDEAGLPYRYIINKDTGHWFPGDLNEKLKEALSFILG